MPADLPSSSRLGPPFSFGEKTAYSAAADLVHHVLPERATRIREAAFFGEQQQARILERRRGQHDILRIYIDGLAREALDIRHTLSAIFIVHPDACGHAVSPHVEIAGLERRRQRCRNRTEHRADIAAVDAISTVVARRPLVVQARELRQPPVRGRPVHAFAGCREDRLRAIQRHGREKHAIGKLRESFSRSAHPDEVFHAGVIGRQVVVADCPIHPIAVARSRFEFVIGHAVAGPRPMQAAAAQTS